MKAKTGDIVQVTWLDACGQSKIEKSQMCNVPPESHLVRTETFGKFFKEDKMAVVILQEDSKDGVDFTAIPKGMIEEIIKLNV